ncbi:hypothetical protein A4A49_35835 [Nicotiana attenuata]|uniref:Uncharacterized protein n=1 Tax=Nicotiana attenuata TaxID=49451 RepID=A0A1J6JX60_NICAT|nr:hypothetical protein A4A49_35835 [Nicotiana attenuata]
MLKLRLKTVLLISSSKSVPHPLSLSFMFENDIATQETKNRIINVLRHLQQTLPSATLESALTYLLPRQEMELKSILSLEEDADF